MVTAKPVSPDMSRSPDVSLSLALAVVGHSAAPLLLLDGDLMVIAASDSFYSAFGLSADAVQGRTIFALGQGEWNVSQLRSLLTLTAGGGGEIEAYEMDINTGGPRPRRLVLGARKLSYGDRENVRLLLTIADVTEARIAERVRADLAAENGVLLKELQHRVANSLQIIASVIMQTARKTQSVEARNSLTDAHSRVMSVAALQTQLSSFQVSDVALGAYFEKLCASIGASMIRDHNEITLTAEVDGSVATADVSVSLGLIVTELVINALKHAFPEGRSGKIAVTYKADGPDWALSVSDDGVGMPKEPAQATPGLGSSIVRALAEQLLADVQVEGADPGTRVLVARRASTTAQARHADEPSAI